MKDSTKVIVNNANELLLEIIEDYSKTKQMELASVKNNEMSKESFLNNAKEHILFFYKVPENVLNDTLQMFEDYVFGYSILTELINDPDISDIRCTGYNKISCKRKGHRETVPISFQSKEEYSRFVDFVATRNQISLSNLNAIQSFSDNETNPDYILRFTIAMPLVNTYDEPYLCIRKVAKNFPTLEMLASMDNPMLSPELANVLKKRFINGSTLICGGNSSGKTTILNALKEEIPHDVSVLITQQSDEFSLLIHPTAV